MAAEKTINVVKWVKRKGWFRTDGRPVFDRKVERVRIGQVKPVEIREQTNRIRPRNIWDLLWPYGKNDPPTADPRQGTTGVDD